MQFLCNQEMANFLEHVQVKPYTMVFKADHRAHADFCLRLKQLAALGTFHVRVAIAHFLDQSLILLTRPLLFARCFDVVDLIAEFIPAAVAHPYLASIVVRSCF
jgi:hypothetical protein